VGGENKGRGVNISPTTTCTTVRKVIGTYISGLEESGDTSKKREERYWSSNRGQTSENKKM